METVIWIFGSVLVVSLVSLVGLFTLFRERLMRKSLLLLVSFSAGALFGDAFIHLLPEAFKEAGNSTLPVSLSVLAGILVFFVLEKVVHWHHCHHLHTANHLEEECVHLHLQNSQQTQGEHGRGQHIKIFGVMNLLGDGIHNAIDGMVIAGSFLVSIPLGIATTIAVVFHEIPQEISDFGVLLHAGFTVHKALFFNFLTALIAFIGAFVALGLNNSVAELEMYLLGFTAGGFIYIAAVDLIPELHKERQLGPIASQFLFILLGILVMLGLWVFW